MSECRKLVPTSLKTHQPRRMLTALQNKMLRQRESESIPHFYWQDLVIVFLNVSHLLTDCDGS